MEKSDEEKEPRESDKCMEKRNGDTADKKEKFEDEEKPPTFKSRMNSLLKNKYGIAIVILCVLVIIFFIVIIALAVKLGNRLPPTVPYCDSKDCLRAAAKLSAGVDKTADPCTNFWQYSCGNWIKETSLDPSSGSYSVKDETTEKVFTKLQHLIDLTSYYDGNARSPSHKIKRFFTSCLNLQDIDSKGETPIIAHINKLGSWKVFDKYVSQLFDFKKVLRSLHVKYEVSPYFRIDVVSHPKESHKAIIKISANDIGLEDYSLYFKPRYDKHVLAYKNFIKDLLRNFREYVPNSMHVDNIFSYEQKIALAYTSSKKSIAGEIVTVSELPTIAKLVPWYDLLQEMYPNSKIDSAEVWVQSPDYMREIDDVISSSNEDMLNMYLIWRLVKQYSKYLSKPFREVHNVYQKQLTGATENENRWNICMRETNDVFGYAVGSLYTHQYFEDSMTEDLKNIANKVVDSMSNDIKNARWMHGHSKDTARKKVKEIQKLVGYPSFILSNDDLNEYYSELQVHIGYFLTLLKVVDFRRDTAEKFLLGTYEIQKYWALPQSQEISYANVMNTLEIPFGVKELPTFSKDFPVSMKYGSVGTLIAQKISQSVTELGSISDEFGLQNSWWTNTTRRKYNGIKKCLVKYYDKYKIQEVGVNGNITVNNNINDVIGLKLAYKAYLATNNEEKSLPGVGVTSKQQFFLSYAQTMCQKVRKSFLLSAANSSSYPANKVRVMASISLLPEFRDAFKCSYKSPACLVW